MFHSFKFFTWARANADSGRAANLMPAMQIRKAMAKLRYKIVTAKNGTTSSILEKVKTHLTLHYCCFFPTWWNWNALMSWFPLPVKGMPPFFPLVELYWCLQDWDEAEHDWIYLDETPKPPEVLPSQVESEETPFGEKVHLIVTQPLERLNRTRYVHSLLTYSNWGSMFGWKCTGFIGLFRFLFGLDSKIL